METTADRYATSREILRRAARIIPGAHHLSGRPLLDPERSPMYFERAKGCRIWDVDGHEFVDYLMAYGALGLGYACDEVDRAAFAQAEHGSLVSLNHPLHVRFVEALLATFPFAEMATFLKTGSEATTAALRIARRATGRTRIVRCGYHGWHDWCVPLEDFVPRGLDAQVLELRSPSDLASIFAAHPREIAAVILAPEMLVPLDREVLTQIAATTRTNGAVFVLDEVKTALRIAPGSIHQRFGVQPDLLTVSKALGNGWPVAAVLGTRAVMEHAAGMHLSATYHGDTAAMAAAMTTMMIFARDGVADRLERLGGRLVTGLGERARHHGIPAIAYGEPLPAMPFLRFVHTSARVNDALAATFFEEVLNHGVLLHPRHLWFVSQAHREEDIEHTLDVCDRAFAATRIAHESAL